MEINKTIGIGRIERWLKWLQYHLNKKQFLLIASVLVGLSAGAAAIVLKTFVHYIFLAATYDKLSDFRFLYLVLPAVGLLLTVFVKRFLLKNKLTKGLPQVHAAIAKKNSSMPNNLMYDQVLTSSVTVGLGGSTGLEAPIVVTGAAIGSNFARKYRLSIKERTLLLACGVAGGIGAAFNAPIAGVLFALEVLLLDISITAFIPLIIAAATGALATKIVLHDGILLTFSLKETFDYTNVPYYALLGLLAGLASVYHMRTFLRVESLMTRLKAGVYFKVFIGGSLLALLIYVFPSLFGEGYQSIKILADQDPSSLMDNSLFEKFKNYPWVVLAFTVVVMFAKPFATALTLGSGGNGGNFAPSLFVGAYLGYSFAAILNLTGYFHIPVNNFTIVGMAGILSGIYHAPLTAIFLIAEITGGYTLMIPLMLVSSISYAVSKYFEPFAMDIKRSVRKGEALTQDRDKNVLFSLRTDEFIEADYPILKPDQHLEDLIEILAQTNRSIFPVLNQRKELLGLVRLDQIRSLIFGADEGLNPTIGELMTDVKNTISTQDSMEEVMRVFEQTEDLSIPIIDQGYYRGFINKSTVFSAYRKALKVNTLE
ncbi:MAG: H(+)/Cl(-) exchange transporter ClcA [Bacteroidota bacterium]|jgi:CIC family chloride channel protein